MLSLAGIVVLGVFCQWLAWRIKLPAILPLILTGLVVGPLSTFFTSDGTPLFTGDDIFNGELLFAFVSISVGLILFEGGMTLKFDEVRKHSGTVRNILTIGLLTTLIGGTLGAHFMLGFSWRISLLFGSLITVSGPTVVMPILRNVNTKKKVSTILKWEGILIDPLGALIAVLAYEFVITSKSQNEFIFSALGEFAMTILTGIAIGLLGGFILSYLMKKERLPDYLRNVVALAMVVAVFTTSDFFYPESGLVATTVMGVLLANMKVPNLRELLSFKEDISLLLITVLFLLLSSRVTIDQITQLGFLSISFFLIMIFLVRPIGIFLSTINSDLGVREKIFISWIGPKGIVAAAVASLFSVEILRNKEHVGWQEQVEAERLLPLVILFVTGTVILQGGSAKYVAKLLKVYQRKRNGLIILGAHQAARKIATLLKKKQVEYLLIDTSYDNVSNARKNRLAAYEGNVLKDDIWDVVDISNMGYLMALTPNSEINELACKKMKEEIGEKNTFRIMSVRESEITALVRPKHTLFNESMSSLNLNALLNENTEILAMENEGDADFRVWLDQHKYIIAPLFVEKTNGDFIPIGRDLPDFSKGEILHYIEI